MPRVTHGRAGPRGGSARKEKLKDRAGVLAVQAIDKEKDESRRIYRLQDLKSYLWQEFRQHVLAKLTEIGSKVHSGVDLEKFVTKYSANLSQDDFETWRESRKK